MRRQSFRGVGGRGVAQFSAFKRRSAMKTLHQVIMFTGATELPVPVIPNAGVPGTVLGYVNCARSLSRKFGRNVVQAKTFRLVGFRFSLANFADSALDIGGSVQFSLRYLTPTRARVAAHERIMREYVGDVRDDSAHSKDRQLIVAYDSVQPVDPVESILWRAVAGADAPHRVHLLGASSAGNLGVFADYNAAYPVTPGTAMTGQPDQDMFTERASQQEDTVSGHATLYSAHPQEVEDIAGAPINFGPWNHAIQVTDWEWWAPPGTFIPLFCGMAKLIMGDSNWPVIQTGATTAGGDNVDQRGALQAYCEFFVEGWTPLSSK